VQTKLKAFKKPDGLSCVSALDSEGRTIWIIDACFDGKRFVVRANEKLTAFLQLEACSGSTTSNAKELRSVMGERHRKVTETSLSPPSIGVEDVGHEAQYLSDQ